MVFDVFFANANGIWSTKYDARHVGFFNGWTGTHEKVNLSGKNRISDIFAGSDDANILVLTDDPNGDSLFVDDIYHLPGKIHIFCVMLTTFVENGNVV